MHVLSVNVGASRTVTIKQQEVQTGLYKFPVDGPVPVSRYGLLSDVLVEPRPMGREHHAVYMYPYEHYEYWQRELGCDAFPIGQFGENLTVTGLLEEEVRIGDIFRVGGTVLQVAHPRIPCAKLNDRMGMRFSLMFMASRKVGFYLRVLSEGSIGKGDAIELLERDEASPTVEEFMRVVHFEYWDAEALQRLLRARDLMPAWREMIEAKLERARTARGWHGLREFEVVRREQECEGIVSLYLKCARGQPLAPFQGGQLLTVVLGGHSAKQLRRLYALSDSSRDLSAYRITVRHMQAPETGLPDGLVSSHLVTMKTGGRILCAAPHGSLMRAQEDSANGRMPVLLSQNLGIAPMLSLLYELEARQTRSVLLFHEAAANEPQGLLREVGALMARNPGFKMFAATSGRIDIKMVQHHAVLAQADIHIAGSRRFVERMNSELTAAGIPASALIVHSFG